MRLCALGQVQVEKHGRVGGDTKQDIVKGIESVRTQEIVLVNHTYIGSGTAHLAKTTGQYATPEQRYLLQQRALGPGHTQQPPALLILHTVQVEIERLQTLLHSAIINLLVIEQAIDRALVAQTAVHTQFAGARAETGPAQEVAGLHITRRWSVKEIVQASVVQPLTQG